MTKTTFNNNKSSSLPSITFILFLKIGGLIVCIFSLMNISYQYGITVGGGGEQQNYANNNNNDERINAPQHYKQQQNEKEKEKEEIEEEKEEEEVIPKYIVPDIYKKEQDRIDNNIQHRCKQFGVKPLKEGVTPYYDFAKRRKIFFGSMLADENDELLLIHAIEVYNMYDNIAFVESNTTHNNEPRSLNYGPKNSNKSLLLTKSELFGSLNKTNVDIEYYNAGELTRMSIKKHPHLEGMDREVEQRNLILGMWIKQGMERHDIGIMADIDEIVSRDFLNSLKVCDFPALRYDPNIRPDCKIPKMVLSTIQYEASPYCIKKNEWFHPDIILGNCLLGVGDNSGRVTPTRNYQNEYGQRTEEYGKHNFNEYPKDVIENKRYPLWDARDIRTITGNSDGLTTYIDEYRKGHGETGVYGTAYHLHNWFNDLEVLRNKYGTYGHSQKQAYEYPLSKINEELDLLVRCHRGLGNDGTIYNHTKYPNMNHENNKNAYEYYNQISSSSEAATGSRSDGKIKNPNYNKDNKGNENENEEEEEEWIEFGGNKPIYFIDKEYVNKRSQLVKKILYKDEQKYGSIYD